MACSSRCPTQDCPSYGECLRRKGVAVRDLSGKVHSAQRSWDSDLSAYESARKQGIQPASTARSAVDAAVRASESTGVAFQA